MECSACGSDHVQKVSVIYESGTTHSRSQASDGKGGVFSGSSQTILAQKIAPPAKAKPAWAGFWIVVGAIGLFLLFMGFATSGDSHGAVNPYIGWLFFLPAAAMIARGVTKAKAYNDTVWRDQYNEWLKFWYCHKCGNTFN